MTDLRDLLPLLESPPDQSGLDDDTATRLVAYGAVAWSDWWASKALDWAEAGVWSDEVADALQRTAQDRTYSQETRHRAWRLVKSKG